MPGTIARRTITTPHRTRTNIVLDDDLLEEARRLGGIATKREVVEEALRLYVRVQRQQALRALRGKVKWEGNLDEMRRGRFADGGR